MSKTPQVAPVWCVDCRKMDCDLTVALKTGWKVVNGERVNIGYHTTVAE